jgi:hypothetical protein
MDIALDTPQQRLPCSKCGETARTIHASIVESVTIRDGLAVKAKRQGEKKPFIEDMGVPSFSHSLQKVVHRHRVIDRDNDLYVERVTDYETGEIIHECQEPLSSHVNHGSAKKKSGTNGA